MFGCDDHDNTPWPKQDLSTVGQSFTIKYEDKEYNPRKAVRGLKHDFSKPQMSLLPMKDLEGVVRVLEFGVRKYARGDWQHVDNGAFRYLDAGLRHLGEITNKATIEDLRHLDPESQLATIDHAICSLIFARHFIFKGEDDGKNAVSIQV